MNEFLIKNGTLITAEGDQHADLRIVGELIQEVGPDLETRGQVIDATDMLILPGGVDPHTHFDLPMFDTVSSDDHYTGHKAAAFGGTTTVMDFVPQDPDGLRKSVALWRQKAEKAAIDYSFHMNITAYDAIIAAEIPGLLDLGITTLKVFTAYNGRLRLDDANIYRVMRIAQKLDMLVMMHAENGDVIEQEVASALVAGHTAPIWHARTRPAWGAAEAVLRGSSLAAQSGAKLYVVHMNTAGGVDMLAYARKRGARVMGETCPQYLYFSETDLERADGAKWICSPPMRTPNDQARLWSGLNEKTLQVIGTDHCPFFYDGRNAIDYEGKPIAIAGKELGADDFTKIPNGLPAVGDRLPVLWSHAVTTGEMTPAQFVALTSTNPAKIFGIYPRKGSLKRGSDADFVIWDPNKAITYGVEHAHHRTDYNLFEGWSLRGYPESVYLRGTRIVHQGRWFGKTGMGQFLAREAGGAFI